METISKQFFWHICIHNEIDYLKKIYPNLTKKFIRDAQKNLLSEIVLYNAIDVLSFFLQDSLCLEREKRKAFTTAAIYNMFEYAQYILKHINIKVFPKILVYDILYDMISDYENAELFKFVFDIKKLDDKQYNNLIERSIVSNKLEHLKILLSTENLKLDNIHKKFLYSLHVNNIDVAKYVINNDLFKCDIKLNDLTTLQALAVSRIMNIPMGNLKRILKLF
jgi:hypothetical protein